VRPDLVKIADSVDPTMDIGVQSDSSSDSSSSSSSSGDDTETSESEEEQDEVEDKSKPALVSTDGHGTTIEQIKNRIVYTNGHNNNEKNDDFNQAKMDYEMPWKK
jgi:hypothetical protein